MKKQFFSFLLLLPLVFSVSAQKAEQPDSTEQNLRTHVEYLASDKLDGRRTGETGATYAAGYIANIFANNKLKAGSLEIVDGKAKTNFLQTFPFITGVEMGAGNAFSLDVSNAGGQKMTFTDEIAFKPAAFSPNAAIGNTAVMFVGYGISSNEAKYDDYANLNIGGRIVVAFDGTPENDNPHSQFTRFNAQAKALIAKEKGAIALLLISREAKLENDSLAQLKYDQTSGEAALPTIVISRKTGADILGTDEAGLKKEEDKFIAKTKNAADNSQPTIFKAVVSFKINLIKKRADAYNVIGILEGTDAQLKNEAIIIGAHYDHLGHGGQGSLAVNSTEIHHGADDNASGVAAMLELARQFAKEKNNKRTLIFIAFGGEEEGLLGSKSYVKNPVFPLDKTVAMINMDMVGRLRDDKLIISGMGTASEWKSLTEVINSKEGKKVTTVGEENLKLKQTVQNALLEKSLKDVQVEVKDNILYLYGTVPRNKIVDAVRISIEISKKPLRNELFEEGNNRVYFKPFSLQLNEDGFGPSDHSSFYGKQIPVLFFFTGSHEDYHKPTDTADKINYDGLLKVENFVGEIVKAIDQNPKRPTFTVAKSSGTGEGRRGFNVSLGTVPSYAEGTNDGLLLDGVRDDSPAAKAGILAGDKIVKMAGREIHNISDYVFVLGEMKAGEQYEIVVLRGGQQLTLKIIPAARK